MSPQILDGKWLSSLVEKDIAAEVKSLRTKVGRPPGLAVILVGDNPASKTYVANKQKLATQCGFSVIDEHLSGNATIQDVKDSIQRLNDDSQVDGILLQLPLPGELRLRGQDLVGLIDPAKDADGLHPLNQGFLLQGIAAPRPCTPTGILKLIDLAYCSGAASKPDFSFSQVESRGLGGKMALVIGRSILVGKPVSLMLQERNATVIMAHSKTANMPELCRDADIVVAAVGVPRFVKGEWIKEGAIVIDVGINRLPSGQLVGDVSFDDAAPHCMAITPVPGGVGPMTVAMLLYNTLHLYKSRG